jgi:hypothetical protein
MMPIETVYISEPDDEYDDPDTPSDLDEGPSNEDDE